MKEIDNIKKMMEELSISQIELSAKCGIAYATINKVLNGKYPLSHKLLVKFAEGLNTTVAELMDEQPPLPITVEVQGYIEYDNEIIKVKSFKQLQKLVNQIEYETKILPNEVKEIRAINKKNKDLIKKSQSNKDYDFKFSDFEIIQSHNATVIDCWAFKTSADTKDGITIDLGNQCDGYPFNFHGHTFYTSESAYLCGQFSNNTEEHERIQNQLLYEKNGYTAKKKVKNANKSSIRADWNSFMSEWMLYVVWAKCQNPNFANKLKSIPKDAVLIENSTTIHEGTSVCWGCKNFELEEARDKIERYTELQYMKKVRSGKIKLNAQELKENIQSARDEIQYIGSYSDGKNYMGKILKRCQLALLNNTEPNINYDLLRSKHIYLFGELLTF